MKAMPNGSRSLLYVLLGLSRLAIRADAAKNDDRADVAFSQKHIAVGAARMSRGFLSPVAKSSTLKPSGAFGQAPAGRGIIVGPLSVKSEGSGCGRSRTVMWCTVPGDWVRKSLNGVSEGATGWRLLCFPCVAARNHLESPARRRTECVSPC